MDILVSRLRLDLVCPRSDQADRLIRTLWHSFAATAAGMGNRWVTLGKHFAINVYRRGRRVVGRLQSPISSCAE
jgi:hypothetical protein